MALNKGSAQNLKSDAFEDMDETEVLDGVAANTVTGDAAGTGALTTAASTAVAIPANTAVATRPVMQTSLFDSLKDAFPVDWDTVPRISASQGAFVLKGDNEEDLGSFINVLLISWQESWVASPNDKKADVELVKYSDDGITSRDGVNLADHVLDLKEQGYRNAKIAHRVTLVVELQGTKDGDESLNGELYQVDLPDTGRRAFNAYKLQASYAVLKGRKTAEEVTVMKLNAVKAKSRSGEDFTKVAF